MAKVFICTGGVPIQAGSPRYNSVARYLNSVLAADKGAGVLSAVAFDPADAVTASLFDGSGVSVLPDQPAAVVTPVVAGGDEIAVAVQQGQAGQSAPVLVNSVTRANAVSTFAPDTVILVGCSVLSAKDILAEASFMASVSGSVMTVQSVLSGSIRIGAMIAGAFIHPDVTILSQTSPSVYQLSAPQSGPRADPITGNRDIPSANIITLRTDIRIVDAGGL